MFLIPSKAFASTINKPIYVLGLETGLVGWWTMDGPDIITNIGDRSGQGNNGSLIGQTSTTTAPGRIGQALSFDGVNDTVVLGGAMTLPTSRTYSLWVKPSNATNLYVVMGDMYHAFWDGGFRIDFKAATGLVMLLWESNPTGSFDSVTSAVAPTLNQWNHIVAVFSSGTAQIFINGVADNSKASAITDIHSGSANRLYLASHPSDCCYVPGAIDDVRVYSRALTASEVLALYKAGQSKQNISFGGPLGLQSGLVGWWTMDGPDTISNVADRSGTGNTGNLVLASSGNTATTTVPAKAGQGVYLEGTDDYINIADADTLDFGTGAFTVMLWAKDVYESTGSIISKGARFDLNTAGWGITYAGSPASLYLLISDGSTRIESNTSLATSTNFYKAPWRQIGMARDSAGKLFLINNGVLTDTGSTFTGNVNNTVNVTLGKNNVYSPYLEEAVDDVRIYNRMLTASEILAHYNMSQSKQNISFGGPIGLQTGLVGWWTMDGPDIITNIGDKSGQGDTGSLLLGASGNTATTSVPGKLGQALAFDSINDYITMGTSYNGVKSVSFWIKVATSTTLQKILDLNGTATVTIDSGTLNGNNFTSPTRYVDGVAASTINNTNWHHVVITTATGINASALDVGRISTTYFGGTLDDVRIYSRALSASEVLALYNLSAK